MAIMGRDPFGISKEGEVHTISYIYIDRDRNGCAFVSTGVGADVVRELRCPVINRACNACPRGGGERSCNEAYWNRVVYYTTR